MSKTMRIIRILIVIACGYLLGIATATAVPKGTFSSLLWKGAGVILILICVRAFFKGLRENARTQREQKPIDENILTNVREDGLILTVTLILLLLSR